MSMIGSLAAFDHWRQRVTLIESVPVLGLDDAGIDDAYDAAIASVGRAVADLARPLPYVAVEPPDPDERAARRQELDARRAVPAGGGGGQGAHRRRRHLPGRAGPALRPRPRRRPVRRVPGAAPGQPEPVHVLRAPPGADDRRLVAGADGPGAGLAGIDTRDLPADRRDPQARDHRRARSPARRRADRAPEGAGRARDARRPRPQRCRARRQVRQRARRRADDAGALQPRDAPHVAGVGRPASTVSARSTCCGPRCRRAR